LELEDGREAARGKESAIPGGDKAILEDLTTEILR